jgi:PelA/Pel-15E family pectate lyase
VIATIAFLFAVQVPRDQWREPPNTPLVTVERIAKFAPAAANEWHKYLTRSRAMHDRDSTAMAAELVKAGKTTMTPAPYTHDFAFVDSMSQAWFGSDTAQRIAEIILSFQAPNGGWSKHVDLKQHVRQPGESYFGESDRWEYISTIDNFSTTEQIEFLLRANRARRDARYENAISRGIQYLRASQYPNGCFPQIYPLQGGYHDAATFNDDATVHVLQLMRDLSGPNQPEYVRRHEPHLVLLNGINCVLQSQVQVKGVRTGWGQQHDPFTLEPIAGRTYELKSLAAIETAAIVDLLMTLPDATPEIVRSVDGAIAWLQSVSIGDYTYSNYELKKSPRAGQLWGRLYEIGTNRIIMANRDGVKLYDWNKLTDRRTGYRWYGTEPAKTIETYRKWLSSRVKRGTSASREGLKQ